MGNDEKIVKSSGKSSGIKNLKPFPKGKSGNPQGKRKGQRDYATIYREALIKIANANHKTPEEIENMMEEVGIKKALTGNFTFWKDVRDRIHGQATQKIAGHDGQSLFNNDKGKQAISGFIDNGDN